MSNNSGHYYPHIDGLRAIAILGVLFYHADLGFSGGYVGVDVFFVISGYLVTGLMLRDETDGQFSIWHFWERRTRRIFPALAVVTVVCFGAAWVILVPSEFKHFASSVIAQAILVPNLYFAKQVGYFDHAANLKPLLHTWSLAVEEQFYLLFPLLFMALRRYSRSVTILAILLIGGGAFGFSIYYDSVRPMRNFYLLPSRAWELLAGSFLAVIPMRHVPGRLLRGSISWAGLLAIGYAMLHTDPTIRFPGVASMLACAGAAAIIWSNLYGATVVGKLLAVRPVVFIGLISYSLYLWHWPMLAFARCWSMGALPVERRVLLLLACVVIAVASWRFVETPFRRRWVFAGRGPMAVLAVSTMAVLSLAAYGVQLKSGVPSRFPAPALQYLEDAKPDDAFTARASAQIDVKEALAGNLIELGTGDKSLSVGILLWGDSHAMMLMPLLDDLCEENHIRGVAAVHPATPPLIGYQSHLASAVSDSISYSNAIVKFVRRSGVGHVILVAKWGMHFDGIPSHGGLAGTIKAMEGTGVRIWIMRQVPHPGWRVPEVAAMKISQGFNPDDLGVPLVEHQMEYQRQNIFFEGIAGKHPNVTILDPTSLFLNQRKQLCRVVANGRALFYDDNHLGPAGANLLRPLFVPIFESIGKGTVQPVGDTDVRR